LCETVVAFTFLGHGLVGDGEQCEGGESCKHILTSSGLQFFDFKRKVGVQLGCGGTPKST
jgi:hypothetical protein